MASVALRSEERIGLAVAAVAHAALVAVLLMPRPAPVVSTPERIEVTFSDDVGLTSTSPEPRAQAAPDLAPTIGEPPPPEPVTEPEPVQREPVQPAPPPPPPQPRKVEPPKPQPPKAQPPRPQPRPTPSPRPVPKATPQPVARPTARPEPPRPVAKPTMRPSPSPSPRATARPAERPSARPAERPSARPAERPSARPADKSGPAPKAQPSPRATGGSRIGSDFLKGVSGTQDQGTSRNPPAQAAGPAVQSALSAQITRQLKPRWAAPQGADAEKLVTILAWNLNRDGSLAGTPQVVRQEGITPANRPQAGRHAEQAVRAVELAAPFDLPEQYYDAWKRVAAFRFDKRLSQ